MTFVAAGVGLALLLIAYVIFVRPADLPPPEPVNPAAHLEHRKGVIYENLRDLAFEYRLGKLSDEDYQKTKQTLQSELAGVLSEIDSVLKGAPPAPAPAAAPKPAKLSCSHCGAKFDKPMKFCGECGKAL